MELSASITAQLDDLLASDDNVVGYSEHEVERPDGSRGVRIYVAEEGPAAVSEIGGMPAEVVTVGHAENKASTPTDVGADPKTRVRPLVGGYSISEAGWNVAGTLGYFIKFKGEVCILTCAHVLRTVGVDVLQPGRLDHGTDPADRVAKVVAAVMDPEHGVDAAAAKLVQGIGHKAELNDLGAVTGTATVAKGQTVRKSGRTTGVTSATVLDASVSHQFPEGVFKNQILVSHIADGGDSGSLVVDSKMQAVGLLKGGSDTHDWINPIGAVLAALDHATLV